VLALRSGTSMCCAGALLGAAVFTAASTRLAVGQERPGARRLEIGSAEILIPAREFGDVAAAVVGPAGAVYVLDPLNDHVVKVDSAGTFEWSVGGEGRGPGEYRDPYRIAARPGGGVAVLDWGLDRITLLSADGAVQGSFLLPFTFTQLDGLAVLRDGRFVVAGMTFWGGAAAGHSVHVFSDSLRYEYSFGQPAEAQDTMVVRYVGSGGVVCDSAGNILLTRVRPYEIDRFSPAGSLLQRTPVHVTFAFDLSDLIMVKSEGRHTLKSLGPHSRAVELPVPARPLDAGGYIGGRALWDSTVVDLIGPGGTLDASYRDPAGCVKLLAVDTKRGAFYCKVLIHDEPMLARVPYAIVPVGHE